jgi:hypothetical protein
MAFLFKQTTDLVQFEPQVLTYLLWAMVPNLAQFSKLVLCHLGQSCMSTTQWPVWALGHDLPI